MGRRSKKRKRIRVSEETHRFLKKKKVENGARSFDELLQEISEEAFGEKPSESSGEKLRESMEQALFGDT